MRNLLILGMLACGAFFAGWFTIERDGDRTRIEINKSEIKGDLSQLKERGREYLDDRREDGYANDQRDSYDSRYDERPSVDYRSYEGQRGDDAPNRSYEDRAYNQAGRYTESRDYRNAPERRPY